MPLYVHAKQLSNGELALGKPFQADRSELPAQLTIESWVGREGGQIGWGIYELRLVKEVQVTIRRPGRGSPPDE